MISVMHSGRFSSKRQERLFWCFTGKRSGGRVTEERKALKASCIQMCASVFTFTIFKKKMKITFQSSSVFWGYSLQRRKNCWGVGGHEGKQFYQTLLNTGLCNTFDSDSKQLAKRTIYTRGICSLVSSSQVILFWRIKYHGIWRVIVTFL